MGSTSAAVHSPLMSHVARIMYAVSVRPKPILSQSMPSAVLEGAGRAREAALTRREDARAAAGRGDAGRDGRGEECVGRRSGGRPRGLCAGGTGRVAKAVRPIAGAGARDVTLGIAREERTRTGDRTLLGGGARLSRAEPWRRDVTAAPRLAAAGSDARVGGHRGDRVRCGRVCAR